MKASELTSKDLMIGDWIQDSFGNIGQVYRLDPGRVHLRLLQERPQDEEYIVHDIEPISLTPKILEKNGFYRSEIPTRDEIGHYYHRKTAPSSIFVSISFDDGRDFGNEIQYVHELQHILRLLEIDKEIVL